MPTPHQVSPVLDALGHPMIAGRVNPEAEPLRPRHFVHDPTKPTHEDWGRYCDWRRSKTPRRDLADMVQRIEDLDQATHEFVGAAAGLGDLVLTRGLALGVEDRDRLRDAIGDLFFTGTWAADAWGTNPLRGEDAPAPGAFLDAERPASVEPLALGIAPEMDPELAEAVLGALGQLTLQVQTLAGLTCDAFRMARWHLRPPSGPLQGDRITQALLIAAQIAAVVGLTVSECLEAHIRTLDARFPDGFVVGGGVRTGEGA
jgi:hypothetical protein